MTRPPELPRQNHPPPTPQSPPPLPRRSADDAGVRVLPPVDRSGWAIAAGYLGLLSLVLLPAPVAVVVSMIAISDINRSKDSPRPKYGLGHAFFGLSMGSVGTLVLAGILIKQFSP